MPKKFNKNRKPEGLPFRPIGECFLFEVSMLGTLEGGSVGVGWGFINMASGV